jgi:ribosomal protein S18 acetylase RimI-like enzyme
MSARVELAHESDALLVGELLHRFNTEFGEPTPGAERLAERVKGLLAEGQTSALLARASHQDERRSAGAKGADGLALLRFRPAIFSDGLECYLAELFVLPELRGRGIGRELMRHALEHARERGADYMELSTAESDIAARRLYESLGFSNREGQADGPLNYYYERGL